MQFDKAIILNLINQWLELGNREEARKLSRLYVML